MRNARYFLLALIVLGACSREDEPPEPVFPIRLFPQKPRGKVLCDETVADPQVASHWNVLLQNGANADLATVADYTAALLEKKPLAGTPIAYVRVFQLPAHLDTEAIARFQMAGDPQSGECPHFYVVELPHDQGTFKNTLERAYAGAAQRDARKRSTWIADRDASGALLSYISFDPAPNGRRMMATFPITDPAIQLVGLQVREKESRAPTTGALREALAAADEPLDRRVQTFRIADDIRRCILLRPSHQVVLEHPPLSESLRFEVGLAAEPIGGKPQRTSLVLECESQPGNWTRVGSRALTNPGVRHPYFESFVVDVPERTQPDQPIRVRASTVGECGILIAEPMLRIAPNPQVERPRTNLLLVSLDTLRKDSLGSYGYSRPTSPNLDSLAARGGRFASVTSVAPYTLPTHATMLTGLFPSRHGAVHPVDRFVADRVEYLPRVLRRYGYHTAGFTGGGYVSDAFGFDAGFDRFSIADPLRVEDDDLGAANPGTAEFRGLYNLDAAANWVEARGDEPWFLFLHTFMVHEYKAPTSDLALFDSQPETTPGRIFPDYILRDEWRTQPPSPGDVQKLRDLYDATIHYADRSLAAFLGRLEASGALANTLVVITSDHGEEFFEHQSLRHSVSLYEELVQVPWVVTGPGIPAGTVVKEPVSQTDLFPTVLDLLDIPVPDGIDGHSRAAALRGNQSDFIETPLFSQVVAQHSRRSALRLGPWKTIRSEPAPAPLTTLELIPAELFDLRSDPGERSNLAGPDSADFKRMQTALQSVETYLKTLALGRKEAAVDPELEERLRQLGYIR